MEEVKKNIKTFLKILEIGKSGSVISWDESNFQRAQKWAQYCEEVCCHYFISDMTWCTTITNCHSKRGSKSGMQGCAPWAPL